MRPIDADALALEVKRWFVIPDNRKTMKEAIDHAPTLDYAPVRHGEWVESTVCVGFYECSQCRSRKRGNQPFFDSVWNYCPNCGAKMDGGKKDG